MLLQSIVAKLDAELYRLREIRRIVNGISSISPLDGFSMELMQITELQQETSGMVLSPESFSQSNTTAPRTTLVPKNRSRSKFPENRALASTIPAEPVVVYAAQVASERQRRAPARVAGTSKGKTAVLFTKPGPDTAQSVEVLRKRWLAQG